MGTIAPKQPANQDALPAARSSTTTAKVPAADSTSKHRRRRSSHSRNPITRLIRRVQKRVRPGVLVLFLIVALAVPVVLYFSFLADGVARANDSYTSLRRLLTGLQSRSLTQITQSDFERIQYAVSALNTDLGTAAGRLQLIRPAVSTLSGWSTQLALLDVGRDVVEGADNMLQGAGPVMSLILPPPVSPRAGVAATSTALTTDFGDPDRITELLTLGQSRFQIAAAAYQRAADKLAKLNYSSLPPDGLIAAQQVDTYLQQFRLVNQILQTGPTLVSKLVGLDDPQNYLLLSANSDEIRPTGGFIGTYGLLRVRRARIIESFYSASTTTSPTPPTEDYGNNISVPSWWRYVNPAYTMWDLNWKADFNAVAEDAAGFYDAGGNPRSPLDGVIGIDLYGLGYLLDAIGPVTVDSYGETVSAENMRDVIYRIRETGDGVSPHKRFLAALFSTVVDTWQGSASGSRDKIISAILRALDEKHLLLYFRDKTLNNAIRQLGWGGIQEPAKDIDYVMISDSNQGSKSSRSVDRQTTYDVQVQADGSLSSRISVRYDYSALVATKDPAVNPRNYTDINYFTLMQVFTTDGITLGETRNVQGTVAQDTTGANGDLITLVRIPYDGTERFQFSYTTPPRVQTFGNYKRYRLLVQKQPGMSPEKVDVQVTLPPHAQVIYTNVEAAQRFELDNLILQFTTTLVRDQWIDIIYKDAK